MPAASVSHADEPADASSPGTPAPGPTPASGVPGNGMPPPARMDRQFIAQNQIVERYLSGRLPRKGVLDFEQFCRQQPQLLDEIGLGDQVHAALRLLEAGGHAPPWEQKPQQWWERPHWLLGAVGLCVLLALVSLVSAGKLSAQGRRIGTLERQLASQPLDPVESTRSILLIPSRTAPSLQSLVTIGGGRAELADLKIDMTRSKFSAYQITIDRVDQGRVAILHNLLRDSNGDLRIALNSSALGPGDYQLSIDGLTWSGAPVPQAWATITIAR